MELRACTVLFRMDLMFSCRRCKVGFGWICTELCRAENQIGSFSVANQKMNLRNSGIKYNGKELFKNMKQGASRGFRAALGSDLIQVTQSSRMVSDAVLSCNAELISLEVSTSRELLL